MKKYIEVIATISLILGGIWGFIVWIGNMANSLSYGDTFSFVLQLVFVEFIIPFYSIIPFIIVFIILFLGALPIYGIYTLFKR